MLEARGRPDYRLDCGDVQKESFLIHFDAGSGENWVSTVHEPPAMII
jgi:hypothetical protein